jgi:hypothetical protein
MSSNPQLDFHPDAESLSAFAEQALPKQEQEQVLAHLALCSRCRQVVYLAQEAASELEMTEAAAYRPELDPAAAFRFAAAMPAAPAMAASASTAGDRGPTQPPWWSGSWRIAWIPAGALAAIIGIVILVHLRQPRQGPDAGTEMAKTVPLSAPEQSAPRIGQKPGEPFLKGKGLADTGRPAPAQTNAIVRAKKTSPGPFVAQREEQPKAVAPPPPAAAAFGAMQMSRSDLDRERVLQSEQRQAVAAQADSGMFSRHAAAGSTPRPANAGSGSSDNTVEANAAPVIVDGAPSGIAGGAAAPPMPSAPPAAVKPESIGSFVVSSQRLTQRSAGLMAVHKSNTVMLPSGLIAVSTVFARQLSLAVDRLGNVYLSQDSGAHWDSVDRQWSGRAIVVRLQRKLQSATVRTEESKSGSSQNEPQSSTADSLAEPPAPASVFEIINDGGKVWVSTDGKTWSAK